MKCHNTEVWHIWLKWKDGTYGTKSDWKVENKASDLPAGIGKDLLLYSSLKVTPLHLMLFICFHYNISTSIWRQHNCWSSAAQPTLHPSTAPMCPSQGLTWLLENWPCFLCVARPRYHITAHMLMQQLPKTPPPPPAPSQPLLQSRPTMEWNKCWFQFK